MRTILLLGWLALPVAGVAYHYGPGQEQLSRDAVAQLIAKARTAGDRQDWASVEARLDEALKDLPADEKAAARQLRLERARAQMFNKKLSTANEDLAVLVRELEQDATADPELTRAAREALANSQYYMTWLMRLEGAGREVWEPEIEAARQNYRFLAEQAEQRGDGAAAQRSREDLESAIKLARLEIKDLQGLPLPSQ